MTRSTRYTMPLPRETARLSWESEPIGKGCNQPHTYAYLIEQLVLNPPPMKPGGYLVVLSHCARLIGPFYALHSLGHFLLTYPALAAPPGSEIVVEGAAIAGPETKKSLESLGIPAKDHNQALKLMSKFWVVEVKQVWDVHGVADLQPLASYALLQVPIMFRAP